MADNLVDWTLDAIVREWPEGELNFPSHIRRINRDEPRNVDTGERSRTVDLQDAIPIGISKTSHDREPMGISYNLRLETTLSVRVEGLHGDEFGYVTSDDAWVQLIHNIKEAITRTRKDPAIDAGANRYYHTMYFENETSQSADNRDYFRENWDLVFHGHELRDD